MLDHVLLDAPAEGTRAHLASRRILCALPGVLGWTLALLLTALASLLTTRALPIPARTTFLPGPPAGRTPSPHRSHLTQPRSRASLAAPAMISRGVERLRSHAPRSHEVPAPGPELIGALPEGAAGSAGLPGGIGMTGSLPLPPPPPHVAATTPARLHVGGMVEAAKLIYQVKPEYPALAKLARVRGKVRLQAVISKGGTVEHPKALEGHPLLIPAALAAVALWRYQPTLLNGQPVEVETEIDVTFTLNE